MSSSRPNATLAHRALALACGLAAAAASATPEADPIGRWLDERGLIDAAAPAAPALHPVGPLQRLRERGADWTADLVLTALHFTGVDYRRGGDSAEQGFDCSGFTRHVFESALGLALPRRSQQQAQAVGLSSVERTELQPGDLVFFNTLRATFSHVGIYIGNGRFVHSPRSGAQVRVEDMRLAYWTQRFDGARRAAPPPGAVGAAGAD